MQIMAHHLSLSSRSSRTSDLAYPECCTNLSLQYLPRSMAAIPSDNEFRSLGRRCMEFAKASQSNGLDVKLSLSIGRVFAFNYNWENNDNLSLPAVVTSQKRKPNHLRPGAGIKFVVQTSVTGKRVLFILFLFWRSAAL